MAAVDTVLADWLAAHHGVVGSTTLDELGVSRRHRLTLLEQRLLIEVHEGVYRSAYTAFDFDARCAAACMADPTLVVSCTSAGRLWDLRRCAGDDIHVVTSRRTKPIRHGVVMHRTLALDTSDIVERDDGIRVTSPARTYFDLARHLGELSLESVAEQLIDTELCSYADLDDAVARLAVAGRAGSTRAARVLQRRAPGVAAVDSHIELVLLDALRRAGVRGIVTQPAVTLRNGAVIHPDLGIPSLGFYVEVDHHTWHGTREAIDRDTERDRQLRLTGAVVERVTDTQIRERLHHTVRLLLTLINHRTLALG